MDLRRSLKEEIDVPIGGIRERGDNQFDIGFTNSFNNAQILIFRSSKVENWIGSQTFLMNFFFHHWSLLLSGMVAIESLLAGGFRHGQISQTFT